MEAATCRKELVIEIPVDAVRRESEAVTARYARVARIPGFRPGHAPPSVVRSRFRDDIRSDVVQSLLPKFFENAVKNQKLSVVGEPRFDDVKFEENQPLTVKASFEVYPEIALKEYEGLEIDEASPTVTDSDVEQTLEKLREGAAVSEVVNDRPAADEDDVDVRYQGQPQGAGGKPVEAREATIHLGGKGTVPAFTENLRGAKPGETREFEFAYPQDYPQKSLAGKTYRYRVEVQAIKKKVLPGLDDDLAKSASDFQTLDELRAKIREDLAKEKQRQVEAEARKKLMEHLLSTHEFPVPGTLVEAQLDRMLENVLSQMLAQGIEPRNTEVDWRKVREESRPEAEKQVRAALILGKIAEAEKIEVRGEEVDEAIREMAEARREPPAALKTRLTRDGMLGRIESSRRNQKALDFVYRSAKITRKSEP